MADAYPITCLLVTSTGPPSQEAQVPPDLRQQGRSGHRSSPTQESALLSSFQGWVDSTWHHVSSQARWRRAKQNLFPPLPRDQGDKRALTQDQYFQAAAAPVTAEPLQRKTLWQSWRPSCCGWKRSSLSSPQISCVKLVLPDSTVSHLMTRK